MFVMTTINNKYYVIIMYDKQVRNNLENKSTTEPLYECHLWSKLNVATIEGSLSRG